MSSTEFHPKAFYRKFDSLLTRIGEGSQAREILPLVLDKLVRSFGNDLKIKSGCIYMARPWYFSLIEGPSGDTSESWPATFSRDDPAVALLLHHKNYIFSDAEVSPWGKDSVALVVGEEDQYLMAFRLDEGWERETLEFSLNTIRSILNYSRSTSRFRADLEEAYEIQKSLLPKEDPVFEGYDIAGRSIAAELVGGDLYDYQLLDEKVLGLAIGDASGHGLPAALLARDVITGLRMGVEKEMKISGVIKKLNHVINRSSLSTRFISLFYGELERNGTLVYINAGHPPPLLFKESDLFEFDVGGTILGPIRDAVFKRGFAFLDPGDVLVLFSDGIIERADHDGEMFGKDRLIGFVRDAKGEPAETIIEKLFDRILDFGGGDKWRDDATVVVIKRTL
ncbi:MAG: PP2C family protein-serine/threonine phosphatase [Candidatus Krumholzibacteria bacterium]|nr:PP2C family protein-serine/threonine phosphatase [Candidatus Krumholzibacteria bacterium]